MDWQFDQRETLHTLTVDSKVAKEEEKKVPGVAHLEEERGIGLALADGAGRDLAGGTSTSMNPARKDQAIIRATAIGRYPLPRTILSTSPAVMQQRTMPGIEP